MTSISRAFPLVVLGLAACGPRPVVYLDAGTDTPPPVDAYRPPPLPYTCEGDVMHVDGVMDETASVTFDTAMTTERPRDLGPDCGNVETTARWAPQEVIEYVVPGSGPVALAIETRFPETPIDFNTLVQVRTSCDGIPVQVFPPTCFDDASSADPRAAGAIMVTGGSTLYLIVTAYSDPPAASSQVDRGVVRVDLRPHFNTPPTVESANVVLAEMATILDVTSTDAEGRTPVYALGLYRAAGRLDLDGNGVANTDDVLVFGFDTITGTGPYTNLGEITPADDGYQIAAYCRTVGCTEAAISVLDESYARSAEIRTPIDEAVVVGRDMECDRTHICIRPLVCTAGICTR